MNKKSVRKVTVSKNVASKSHKKSKISFKTWLAGILVLVVAIAYGMLKLQTQPLKVLEVSGTLIDYIPANPIDINIISPNNLKNLPKSDVPEVNAAREAVVAKQNAIRNGRSEEEAEKIAEAAAERAVRESYQAGVASGAITMQDAVNAGAVQNRVDEAIKDVSGKTEAEKAAEYAKDVVRNVDIVKNADGTITINKPQPTSSQSVTDKKTCQTAAGFSVYEGETMIGLVVEGKDSIVECSNGRWVPVTAADGTACFKGDTRPECKITVKPIYQQQAEGTGANCYVDGGSVVVGNGSVVESDGKNGKQCRGTKDLEKVTNYNGAWLTDQEIQNIENFKKAEAEKRAKEEADVDAKNAKECKGTYDPSTNICTPKIETPKVINSKGTKTGGELTTNSGDCIYGATPTGRGDSRSAEYRCNDSTGKVPQTSEKCQAQGTVVVCKVYDLSGKYLSEYRKSPETVKNEVNPGAKLLGGETTIDDKECLYGATPALDGSGRRLAGKYICNNEQGERPRVLTALPETFGNNQTLTPAAAQNLTDPNKPWSATNPVAVSKSEDCPPGSSSRTRSGSVASETKFCYPDPNLSKLPPGAECDVAGVNNNACQSNSCRKMTKPGESEAKFYCLPENTYKSDVRQPDGTLLYKNGTVCRSGSDCASGFCADFAFSWSNIDSQNRCIDNPFVSSTSLLNTQPLVPNSQSVADKKEVNEEVALPGDCESGKAAYIGFQVGGKSFRCKPASFCPEQDLEKMVTCFDNGDPICTSGAPWKPGVDCRMDSSSTNNSNELNAVGTLNDSTNPNTELIGPVLPAGYKVQMQNASNIASYNLNINNINTTGGTTNAEVGCAPTTVINALRYLETIGEIPPLVGSNDALLDELITRSNFHISCTPEYGCSSGVEAMLKVLQNKYGIEGAYTSMDQNKITSATAIEDMNGIFLYQGDAYDPSKKTNKPDGTFGHNTMFICKDGKCINIDSYTGNAEPRECVSTNETTLLCGTTEYELSTELRDNGEQSAAYQLPIDLPSN